MKQKSVVGQIVLVALLIIGALIIITPIWLVFAVSVSSENDIMEIGYQMIPKHIDWSGYQFAFKTPKLIFNAYKVTIIFSFTVMVLNTFLNALIAYPLSKKGLKGRTFINFYLYFTCLFGGGLVPTYILITQYLHLQDTIWVYIVPALVSPWTVFMIRSFFQGIPNAIFESALIDGASEFRIFIQMVIPLSKPCLATMALMCFLSKWNSWYESMLYINNQNLYSLQYLLQKIMKEIELILNSQESFSNMVDITQIPTETYKMAMAVIVMGPALLVFPFFQKYFVKGLTVGSVKG